MHRCFSLRSWEMPHHGLSSSGSHISQGGSRSVGQVCSVCLYTVSAFAAQMKQRGCASFARPACFCPTFCVSAAARPRVLWKPVYKVNPPHRDPVVPTLTAPFSGPLPLFSLFFFLHVYTHTCMHAPLHKDTRSYKYSRAVNRVWCSCWRPVLSFWICFRSSRWRTHVLAKGASLSLSDWSWPGAGVGGVGGGLSPSPLLSSAGCFSRSVYATQKQPLRKKNLCVFGWVWIISPRSIPQNKWEHSASIINMLLRKKKKVCLCVFWHKTIWSSWKVFTSCLSLSQKCCNLAHISFSCDRFFYFFAEALKHVFVFLGISILTNKNACNMDK